jgi:UDP:flavonoid glycosyltransferase YjiC (YdhE family)
VSRFLFAWELGGGLGHLGPLLPVARSLRARGHHVAFALRDLSGLAALDPAAELQVLQAPVCIRNYPGLAEPPLNYAEVLMRYGYLEPDTLTGLVRGWRELVRLTGADVIVADHAPSAIVAAKTLSLRCALTGNGFYVPPMVSPTPNMRPWVSVPPERLASSDKRVVDTMNAVFDAFGSARIAHLYELFDVDAIVMTAFAELDQYASRSEADLKRMVFCGPVASIGADAAAPVWPAVEGKRIFAYLKPEYPHLAAVLNALAASAQPCLIYGLGANLAAPAAPNLVFATRPVDVEAAGRECAIGICHASSTTTAALLQAGRPLLLLPMQLEQFLAGSREAELGAGLVINPEDQQPDVRGALARLLEDQQLSAGAHRFAERYRDWSADRILDNIVTRLASVAPASPPNLAGTEL